MSLADAGAFAGVCKREIERAIAAGELESLYHGRKPVVPKRSLVAWLASKLETERAKQRDF